ncbi:MAG: ribosome rescue protein RqcH [Candidatus Bathyarchaeia archaeon]
MQKREFTSFDVAAVVHELKEKILNSFVSNIYQANHKKLILKLRKSGEPPARLLLEAGKRMHLTSYAFEKPIRPPAFCMALRKYLRNSLLVDVEQYEFERVVILHFKAKAEKLKLILELFGEGNIILIGEKGEILLALTYKRMRDRNILRGTPFLFPPSSGKNPFKIEKEGFFKELKDLGEVEVVRALARSFSIGGIYAEEILLKANVDKTKACKILNTEEIEAIFENLQHLLTRVSEGLFEPTIFLNSEGKFIDVAPFKLKLYEGFKPKLFSFFNEALDEFYIRAEVIEKAAAYVEIESLRREVERLRRIIENQEKALKEAEAKAQNYKRIGDAIYAYANELQMLLDKFLACKASGGDFNAVISELLAEKKACVKPGVFFESFDVNSLKLSVCVDNLEFSLDLRKSLFDNAAWFYMQSKKAKQKLEGAKTALEESRSRLAEAETKLRDAEVLQRIQPTEAIKEIAERKIKRKEWYEKFKWFISSEGFLVLGGKDAITNEVLIKKYTTSEDMVFHADIVGAPFVVIKTEGKQPSPQCLKEAAEFAAANSRGWREGFATVDVYWVKPNQLSKAGPSGEYVPHGAFVVRGKRNWMRNIPLRIAVGITIDEETGEIKFVGGAVDAVRAKAKAYITIVPGDMSGKNLLNNVLKALAEKMPKEQREKVLKKSIEEIREFIPYVKGRILTE